MEIKTVNIGEKEYAMRCSVMTTEVFERNTGKKFGSVVNRYQKLGKAFSEMNEEEANAFLLENIFDIEMDALQLSYYMILDAKKKGYNQDFNCTLEDFIDNTGTLSSEELKGVLAIAMSVFPRKV